MKHIYIRVQVPDDTDIYRVHEKILDEHPEVDDVSLAVYENYDAVVADIDG